MGAKCVCVCGGCPGGGGGWGSESVSYLLSRVTRSGQQVAHHLTSLEEEGYSQLSAPQNLQALGQTQLLSTPKMQNKDGDVQEFKPRQK